MTYPLHPNITRNILVQITTLGNEWTSLDIFNEMLVPFFSAHNDQAIRPSKPFIYYKIKKKPTLYDIDCFVPHLNLLQIGKRFTKLYGSILFRYIPLIYFFSKETIAKIFPKTINFAEHIKYTRNMHAKRYVNMNIISVYKECSISHELFLIVFSQI